MKNMRNKIIGAAVICAFAPLANAASDIKYSEPYLGFEVIQTNQNYKSGYGKDVFKKNPQNYSFFGGFKFYKQLGVEAGYEFQPTRNKNAHLTAGQAFPGLTPVTGTNFLNTESSISNNSPYIGLFGEAKHDFKSIGLVKFQGLLGLSVTHVKARAAIVSNQTGTLSPANYAATVSSFSKTRVVPMVKLMATFMVSNNVGIRLSANYRNMGAFNIKRSEGGNPQLKLQDMFGVGLGLTYAFGK